MKHGKEIDNVSLTYSMYNWLDVQYCIAAEFRRVKI